MESTNLHHHHHHQLQDQPPTLEPSSLSATATPSSFHGTSLGGITNHSWTLNNIILNAGGNNPRSRGALTDNNNDIIGVPLRPLIQDLGYHHHHHHLDLQQIKEEINFPKFSTSTEMLNIPSSMEPYGLVTTTSTTTTTHHMKNDDEHKKDNDNNNMNAYDDLNEKLLLKTLFSAGDFYSSTNNAQSYYPHHNFGSRGGKFSQIIYPSINISNLNQQPSNSTAALVSSPMESLDLLTSPSTSFSTAGLMMSHHHHSQDLGRFSDNLSFRLDHMQHHHTIHRSSSTTSSSNSNPSSHFPNGTAEAVAKRPCRTSMELESSSSSKASHQSQTASKKSRSEPRPSCPPFKVRKEKLGDRIAALQQLVAPFGKTDTASVLMEAIGYIKFLQSQVETLSVPYMKSSQNQTNRVKQGGSGCIGGEGNGEAKQDLRSRGLCLVPLSCMSYFAADGGTEVWQQQPNFGGAT